MNRLNRRRFIARTSAAAATAATILSSRVFGANERVNLALIGCGGRGSLLARGFIERGANLACVCDLLDERLDNAAKMVEELQGRAPKKVKQMRAVLDSDQIDAVVIGLPDHWHGPASILACQAGKDVYVEKPHAHNIWESRKMIEASRKYKRVLQVGTQNRSAPYNLQALDIIQSGKLGKIHIVKVYNLKPGGEFRLGDPGKTPADFDWDAWQGGAPSRPYHQRIFNGGWHHFWDYSGGDFADDGIHQLDLAMMLMGNPGIPHAASTSGGRLAHAGDDSEVPDVMISSFDFDDFVMTFEHSNYPPYMRKTTATIRRNDELPYWTQNSTRIELYGTKLMMIIGRHGGGFVTMTSGGKIVDKIYGRFPDPEHQTNFLECIKSRKRPNADIEKLHASCVMLHQANIAHRLGNVKLRFDAEKERFVDCDDANKLIKRDYRPKYEAPEKV